MKKSFFFATFVVAVMCVLVSCKKKEETPAPVPEPIKKEAVYKPTHGTTTVELNSQKYEYINAPFDKAAKSVVVEYPKYAFGGSVVVKYSYANGDTFTYTIPADFGLAKNEAGKFRVVQDESATVWLQGYTKKGRFKEFIFYGFPENKGQKINPNSYKNEIKYHK